MDVVRVRPATVDDADAIGAVHVRSWQAGYRGLMPEAVLAGLDPADRAARWRELLARPQPGAVVFVAVRDAAVLGFASAGTYRDGTARPDSPDAGEVYAIYVDPPHWGGGVGRALMDAAVGHLTGTGRRPVRLWALDGNDRARRFYERYGFVADGAAGSHPVDGGVEVPTIRFTVDPA
ncbi:N-acetyltransferase family protein [Planosporangium sp. 12N6]|uniref:GNAT family N-acetyltransferase n=1 Tax=Planosporangium spinosum TaxID=3402278 RepID=UPI003CF9EC8D